MIFKNVKDPKQVIEVKEKFRQEILLAGNRWVRVEDKAAKPAETEEAPKKPPAKKDGS